MSLNWPLRRPGPHKAEAQSTPPPPTSISRDIARKSFWGIRLLEITLVLGLIYFAVRAIIGFAAPESLWQFASDTASDTGLNPSQPMSVSLQAAALSTPALGSTFDPFHRQSVSEQNVQIIGEDAPETTLKLRLFGLRAGEAGSAILQTPDNEQGVFEIGDEIISGVRLKSVSSNFIVLSHSGVLERLTFEREGALQRKTAPVQKPRKAGLKTLSPQDLLAAMSLKPVREGKRLKGYRIAANTASVDLRSYGLQPGDIITHIDSENLTQGRVELGALGARLAQKNAVTVSIIRGQENKSIRVGQK